MELILGIETSCDETAAALLDENRRVIASTMHSQVDLHARYGGVVPEIAGRSHVETILPVLEEVFEKAGVRPRDVGSVAVTFCPGLIGSLLVGVSCAKAFAAAQRIPLIPVNHVEAHVYSCFHEHEEVTLPAACLVVSGGHTSLYWVESLTRYECVGRTIDDAAGEAFDKVAALLDLPYPGGPVIDRLAKEGDPRAISFPRSMLGPTSLDFSFSGLKTAVLYHCRGPKGKEPREISEQETRDIAASFQEAVIDVLLKKMLRLVESREAKSLALGGGVAANGRLRERAQALADQRRLPLYLAPRALTTDNAVMVAGLGRLLYDVGVRGDLALDATPHGITCLPS